MVFQPIMQFKYVTIPSSLRFVKRENRMRNKDRQKLWVPLVRKKKVIRESEEEEKSNQFMLCKSVQRIYLWEKILFIFSYIEVTLLFI